MLNVKDTVIARNGTAGVQFNGTNAAALIDTTLLDSNPSGALTTINGGRLLTYGNNDIIGSAGSDLTGTAPSQERSEMARAEHAAGTDLDALPRYHFRAKTDKILESA